MGPCAPAHLQLLLETVQSPHYEINHFTMSDGLAPSPTKKITLGFILSWILAIFFGVPGILMLFESHVASGALLILTALVLLPPIDAWVEKQLHFALSSGLKAVVVIVLLVAAGAAIGTPPASPSVASTDATTPAQTAASSNIEAPAAPPIAVSATQLSEDYDANEIAADAKYKNKAVDVTGTIDTIGKDILNNPYVALKTAEYSAFSVQCMFPQSEEATLANLSAGQQVTLEGTVSGKTLNVLLDSCSIINQ